MITFVEPHRKTAREVTEADMNRFADELTKMVAFMQKTRNCVGLAHPQIDDKDPLRFFITRKGVYINPKITRHSSYTVDSHEGCYSYPNKPMITRPRYRKVDVEYTTYNDAGQHQVEETLTGYDAYVFQHEMDHLEGKYCYDA